MKDLLSGKLPRHLKGRYITIREFKDVKRREVEDVLRAMGRLQVACAFMPFDAYLAFNNAMTQLRKVRTCVSRKNWGR